MNLEINHQNIIFICGKGGVGKTTLSLALSTRLAELKKNVLWIAFEDPGLPSNHKIKKNDTLTHLNCSATDAFDEYVQRKLGGLQFTRFFTQSKLIRYLSKAAPGLSELVLLGKVWHERTQYDHVVVDMPSTGYGIAMFQSTLNFSKLFKGSPLQRDSDAMIETFSDSKQTYFLIVGLPEETPLQESLDLKENLKEFFPEQDFHFVLNRKFPNLPNLKKTEPSHSTPIVSSAIDYAYLRSQLEKSNLRIWEDVDISYASIPYFVSDTDPDLIQKIGQEFEL